MLFLVGALFVIAAVISEFVFSSRWWLSTVLGIPWWAIIFMFAAVSDSGKLWTAVWKAKDQLLRMKADAAEEDDEEEREAADEDDVEETSYPQR